MIDSQLISYHKILPIGEFLTLNAPTDKVKIIHTHQTHSTIIVEYNGQDLSNIEADGIMTTFDQLSKKISIAIKTADCMPIVILGKEKVVFLHAGWKGLADGILKNPLISSICPHYAFIGPSIQSNSFEVSEDFKSNFDNSSNFYSIGKKYYFDLQKEASEQLYSFYNGIHVESCKEDTLQQKKFHSYRRNKTSHRNWNLFTLSV